MQSQKLQLTNFPPKHNYPHNSHKLPYQNYPSLYFIRHTLNLRAYNNHNHNPILIASKLPSIPPLIPSHVGPNVSQTPFLPNFVEELLEKVIYRMRFVTLLGVFGSLLGSVLCFIKGCTIVARSVIEHSMRSEQAIVLLVEATDVYLLGTVMLVFGMGIYELFVSNLDIAKSHPESIYQNRSNLFGLFTLSERPKWLEIKSVNELKTKVGHMIVLLLLLGLSDKSKKAAINTPLDLMCFAASVLLCSGCLYLLSKLNGSN